MPLEFPEVVLVVGLLLVFAGAVSGLAHGTVVSISVLAVAAGMALNGLGLVEIAARDPEVIAVVELALVFTLFSDGLVVERELLVGHSGPPARALLVAMPATMLLIGGAAKLLFDQLSWAEALLLGAVLAPTDPVVTSAVVAAKGVPARLRHTLNLESGANDGLALPFVLVLIAIAAREGSAAGEAIALLGEAAAGAAIGLLLATAAGRAIPRLPGSGLTTKYEGVYALGIGLAAFGIAESTVGNGLVAAFVAGIALALVEHEIPEAFHEFNESVGEILAVITFFVFGSLLIQTGWPPQALAVAALVAFTLLIARPATISLALLGSSMPPVQRRFLAWFGPKGVASMLFALFVLKSDVANGPLLFQLASMVILGSVLAHGLTDTLGARWIDRRLGGEQPAPEPGRA